VHASIRKPSLGGWKHLEEECGMVFWCKPGRAAGLVFACSLLQLVRCVSSVAVVRASRSPLLKQPDASLVSSTVALCRPKKPSLDQLRLAPEVD